MSWHTTYWGNLSHVDSPIGLFRNSPNDLVFGEDAGGKEAGCGHDDPVVHFRDIATACGFLKDFGGEPDDLEARIPPDKRYNSSKLKTARPFSAT